jgi:hypothetical protein
MLQNPMMKQMIDFQKTIFENSFNAMTGLQEQGEKVMETFLNQATWLPNEGKKAVLNWVDVLKKGRDQFKQTVELNFSKMESSFGAAEEKKK